MIITRMMKDYKKSTGKDPIFLNLDNKDDDVYKYIEWLEEKAEKFEAVLDRLKHSRELFKLLISSVAESEPHVAGGAETIDFYIWALLNGIIEEEWAKSEAYAMSIKENMT